MVSINNKCAIAALNQFGQKYPREDGTFDKIMVARMFQQGESGTMLKQGSYVAFEIPAEYDATNMDLLSVVEQWYQQLKDYNQDKECIFLGNLYGNNSPEFMQYMQGYVDREIGSQIKSFEENEKQKAIQNKIKYNELNAQEAAFEKRIQDKKLAEKINLETLMREYRKNNPGIGFKSSYKASDGKSYMDYDGIDINRGWILRLRKVDKIAKDSQNNYLYSGYISRAYDEADEEINREQQSQDSQEWTQ